MCGLEASVFNRVRAVEEFQQFLTSHFYFPLIREHRGKFQSAVFASMAAAVVAVASVAVASMAVAAVLFAALNSILVAFLGAHIFWVVVTWVFAVFFVRILNCTVAGCQGCWCGRHGLPRRVDGSHIS